MQQIDQNTQASVDARYRTMLISWLAFFSFIGIYFLFSRFIQQPEVEPAKNKILTVVLSGMGTLLVVVSLAIKQRFLNQSVEKQDPMILQKGFIVAIAMCESSALFGLVDLLATGNRYYFVMLIIAAIGIVLHFPRRDHLLAASYKNRFDARDSEK